jgi:hypothetical protein
VPAGRLVHGSAQLAAPSFVPGREIASRSVD